MAEVLSLVLVRISDGTWVDPTKIVAIEWALMPDCPKVYLSSGTSVLAVDFGSPDYDAEGGVYALLAEIHERVKTVAL